MAGAFQVAASIQHAGRTQGSGDGMRCNVVSHYRVVGVGRLPALYTCCTSLVHTCVPALYIALPASKSLEAGRAIKLGQARTLWISRELEGCDRPCDEAMKWEWDGSAGNTSTHRRWIKGAGGVDGCGQHVAPGLERGTQQSSQGVA
jgi:hypothetical protein